MSDTRQTVYFALPDLDNTTATLAKTVPGKFSKAFPHFISYALRDFMLRDPSEGSAQIHYAGFIAITHRDLNHRTYRAGCKFSKIVYEHKARAMLISQAITEREKIINNSHSSHEKKQNAQFEINEYLLPDLKNLVDYSDINLDDKFIHRLVENIQKSTNIPLITVSTPHDDSICGEGYEKIIEPFERSAIKEKRFITRKIEGENYSLGNCIDYPTPEELSRSYQIKPYDAGNKNNQLFCIIKYILKKFGNDKIYVLDFVDDYLPIIKNALKINPAAIPENFIIRVFEANANDVFHKIKLVGIVKGLKTSVVAEQKEVNLKAPDKSTPLNVTIYDNYFSPTEQMSPNNRFFSKTSNYASFDVSDSDDIEDDKPQKGKGRSFCVLL